MRATWLVLAVLSACGGSSGGGGGDDGSGPDGGGGDGSVTVSPNGNPDGHCLAGVPAGGMSANVSSPTSVVGDGSAGSCTFTALNTAVTKGGVITFNCGAAPVTI